MSTTIKSPLAVARRALATAAKTLRPFAHHFSPQRYTQPHLFACLTLQVFFKTDYQGITQLLSDLSDLRQVLGLRCVPHFTTLQKARKRLLSRPRARRLLHATLRRFQGRRTRVRRAAFDSTGLDCGPASRYFIRHRSRGATQAKTVRYTHFLKLEWSVDTDSQAIRGVATSRGVAPRRGSLRWPAGRDADAWVSRAGRSRRGLRLGAQSSLRAAAGRALVYARNAWPPQ